MGVLLGRGGGGSLFLVSCLPACLSASSTPTPSLTLTPTHGVFVFAVLVDYTRFSYTSPLLYHTVPYRTIPYHTIPHHTAPYRTTPYHTIPHHTILHPNPYTTIHTSAHPDPTYHHLPTTQTARHRQPIAPPAQPQMTQIRTAPHPDRARRHA